MKQENIDILNTHIHHWHSLRDNGCIYNFSGDTGKELLRIAREQFDARYLTVLHNPECVCNLIRYVYGQFERKVDGSKLTVDSEEVDPTQAGLDSSLALDVDSAGVEVNSGSQLDLDRAAGKTIDIEVVSCKRRKKKGHLCKTRGKPRVPCAGAGFNALKDVKNISIRPPPEESHWVIGPGGQLVRTVDWLIC